MNYLNAVKDFQLETVQHLQKLIEIKRNELREKKKFVNPILREDIFDLLGECCTTVLYYPLHDDENDGFHISEPVGGQLCHFVYINTAKPLAKQVFAAAHELGHIWTSDEDFDIEDSDNDALMNRFAAELLMPEDIFASMANEKLNELQIQDQPGKISEDNLFRVVAALMDEFYVPFQSVIRRLEELNFFDKRTCRYIVEEIYEKGVGTQLLDDCVCEGGYSARPATPDERKYMTGFSDMLNQMEERGLFAQEKVAKLREILDMRRVQGSTGTISLKDGE